MSALIYILNGPNLNLLGQREPDLYGHETLDDVGDQCAAIAREFGLQTKMLQSNHEGQLVDWIQQARTEAAGIIINPGALAHTSIAVLDALNAFDGPVIEVHVSQIHRRERFRHHSYTSRRADALLAGFGASGYALAMRHMGSLIKA